MGVAARPRRRRARWWRCSTGSPSSPRTSPPSRAWTEGVDRHLADSLAGLRPPEVAAGRRPRVDLGSGAGFPGLALAIARPDLAVTLVESESAQGRLAHRASAAIPNVRVVADRSEHLAGASARPARSRPLRALGPLPVALELAAPLVAVGGTVVAWRGDDADPRTRRRPPAPPRRSAWSRGPPVAVRPFPGARRRLHEFRKRRPDARALPAPRRPRREAPARRPAAP